MTLERIILTAYYDGEGYNYTGNVARLKRIVSAIRQAGYKSPEEVKLMFNPDYLDFQKGVEATKELWKADKREWKRKEADWLENELANYRHTSENVSDLHIEHMKHRIAELRGESKCQTKR